MVAQSDEATEESEWEDNNRNNNIGHRVLGVVIHAA